MTVNNSKLLLCAIVSELVRDFIVHITKNDTTTINKDRHGNIASDDMNLKRY